MIPSGNIATTNVKKRPNGSGAAAILSAAVGSLSLALLALAADKSPLVKSSLIFYKPTGPLSGVTDLAILIWLALWTVLEVRWRKRDVAVGPVSIVSFILLGVAFLLTFPPLVDLL